MLDVAPNNEEAIAYTVDDPEIDHEEAQFNKGIVKSFSPQKKPREDA